MPVRKSLYAIGALALLGTGATQLAMAQWQNSPLMKSFSDNWRLNHTERVGQLASNEGLYVDMSSFNIAKGTAKGDPATQMEKMGAREVSDGAIIFRSGKKLYIIDGKPGN